MLSLRTFRIIRIIIWILPIVLFGWILAANVAPSGSTTLHCTVERCDPRFKNLGSKEPEELLGTTKTDTRERYRVLTRDPFYFDARLFRPMKRATVRLVYQSADRQARLRLGIVGKGIGFEFTDFADNHALLRALADSPEWTSVREGDDVLFARKRDGVRAYPSLRAFFHAMPDRERTAVHTLEPAAFLAVPDYTPTAEEMTFPLTLTGEHAFLVYVGDREALDVRFTLQETNETAGADDMAVQVLRGGDVLATKTLPDDRDQRASRVRSEERELRIVVPNLPEGVYHVNLIMKGDDAMIRSLTSRQRLLVIPQRLALAAGAEPTTLALYGATTLTATIEEEEGLPKIITVAGKKVKLTRAKEAVSVSLQHAATPVELSVPAGAVVLQSDGWFTPSSSAFIPTLQTTFDPLPADEKALKRYDYVVARFPMLKADGPWLVAEKTIDDLPSARTVQFLLSGDPAIGTKEFLRVRDLTVAFEGDPLTPRLAGEFARRFLKTLRQGTP